MSSSPPPSRSLVPSIPVASHSTTASTFPRGNTRGGPAPAETHYFEPSASSARPQYRAPATDTNASAAVAQWVRNTQLSLLGRTHGSSFNNTYSEARACNESASEDKENYAPLPPATEILCSQSHVCEGNLRALDARLEVLRREIAVESEDAMPLTDHLNIVGFLDLDADLEMGVAFVEDEDAEDAGSEAFSDEDDGEELEDDDEDDWEDGCDVDSNTGSIHIRLSCA
ncbi:hypothetical protein K438DRAFT_1952446 [Mycena galopus ATCC 62051]|nr:hypothetical protein K438DRAFT_1952446 [Mycena galopus ATCC 62051]